MRNNPRKLWGDGVVGEDSLHKCIGELRRALEDKDQTTIQTIPGRGYMLVTGSEAAPLKPASPTLRMRPRSYVIAAAVAGALALAIAGWNWYRMRQGLEIRSVAVLPFASPTGDARTAAIAEGLAESVAARLSRSGGIRVASFEAAWRLSRANPDPQRTGRDLSVDAVVVGRVRAEGDRLTVAVEIVRVADQTQLWGRDFSATTARLSELHFEIADIFRCKWVAGKKRIPEESSPTASTPMPTLSRSEADSNAGNGLRRATGQRWTPSEKLSNWTRHWQRPGRTFRRSN